MARGRSSWWWPSPASGSRLVRAGARRGRDWLGFEMPRLATAKVRIHFDCGRRVSCDRERLATARRPDAQAAGPRISLVTRARVLHAPLPPPAAAPPQDRPRVCSTQTRTARKAAGILLASVPGAAPESAAAMGTKGAKRAAQRTKAAQVTCALLRTRTSLVSAQHCAAVAGKSEGARTRRPRAAVAE